MAKRGSMQALQITGVEQFEFVEFDDIGSGSPLDSTRIHFSRSTNAGATWSHLRAPEGLPPRLTASDVDLDPIDRNRVFAVISNPRRRP